MSKLVVKPFQKQEVSNTKLTTIAILNQVILEKFDEIADNKEVWNQRFKNIGKQNISMIEDLQSKIYNQHYEANQKQFIYADESTRRLINLLSTLNIDEYIDLMGFVELKLKHWKKILKMFNVKAIFCTESDKLKNFTNGNYDNLSQKRKVEFNKLQKEIKSKYNVKTS